MVNTFLVGSIRFTCKTLDNQRLGKQRVEAMQIIDILESKNPSQKGFINHPAVKMWQGHVDALKYYCNKIIKEWIKRGFKNTMELYVIPDKKEISFPWWYKFEHLHLSHQASLIRKNKEFYTPLFEMSDKLKEHLNYGYLWPHKYDKSIKKDFKLEMCESLTGEWTREHIEEWIKNPEINPLTKRKIKINTKAGVYSKLLQAAKTYGYSV